MAKRKSPGTIRIKQVGSVIGNPRPMRETVRALGFRRISQIVERPDTPETRGMIAKVHHLVEVVEQ